MKKYKHSQTGKKTIAKPPKKLRVERTRASNTLTESQFWGKIRASLRNASRWWKPIADAKKNARRVYKGANKRQKWEYQCAECHLWFKDKEIEVDHIVEVGSLKCAEDLPQFVERLFCEVDGLQVMCKPCHRNKTHGKN